MRIAVFKFIFHALFFSGNELYLRGIGNRREIIVLWPRLATFIIDLNIFKMLVLNF